MTHPIDPELFGYKKCSDWHMSDPKEVCCFSFKNRTLINFNWRYKNVIFTSYK